MKGVEGFIKIAEEEIEHLNLDMNYCRNDITIRILENAIENRKNRIEEVKIKYLNV